MYAKLVEGELIIANQIFITPEGEKIVGFNNNIALMNKYGFKEVVDLKPIYDDKKQYLTLNDYIDNEYNIIVTYKIIDLEPNLEEIVKVLRKDLEDTRKELSVTQGALNDLIMNMVSV